jgi:type IV pilus biogenesis protein PilP
MQNKWSTVARRCASFCLILGAALGPAPALAASTADELAELEAENVLLKARLRMLETRAQMAARRADIERLSPGDKEGGAMPTVIGIDGLGNKLQATVMMDNGYLSDVKAGHTLPNGMKVVSIGVDGVTVQASGGKRLRLKPGVETEQRNPALRAAELLPSPVPVPNDRIAVMPPLPERPGTAR